MAGKARRSIVNTIITCGQCELNIKDNEDNIQCDKCEKIYHAICTSLNKRQYEHLLENEREEYVCDNCNKIGGDIKSELGLIKTQLKKLNQLDNLQESMQFMSTKFDEILKGIADNKKKLDAVQKENVILKNEIKELKTSVRLLNDFKVKNDCIVNGVEIKDDANPVETMINLMKTVNVDLKPEDFDDVYFLKKRNNSNKKNENKRTMIVKFNNNKTKKNVMQAKSKLLDEENTSSIFVNEFLSKETFALLNHARSLKSVGYNRVYAATGKVFAKKSQLSKPIFLRSEEEVDKLLLEATTNKKKFEQRKNAVNSNPDDTEDESSYLSPAV